MTIVRRLARPLLAAPLIQTGIDVARHPAAQAEVANPVLRRVSGPLRLPQDPILVIRASGAVTAAAGVLLATGRLPRLSAIAIVATAPVVQSSQPFWKEKDPQLRRSQRDTFVKNLGLLGGALLATVDTGGKPGLAWRGRKAGQHAADLVKDASDAGVTSVKDARKSAKKAAKDARSSARKSHRTATKQAQKEAAKATKAAGKLAAKVEKKATKALSKAEKKAGLVTDKVTSALPG
jgi:putative oxidoreductase